MSGEAQLLPWQVVERRTLVDDRWLRLEAQVCRTAEGVEIAPYYVKSYPDWALVVAIDAADRLLMVEQYRHALGIVSLELPGGCVDPEDDDVCAAGARELLEETGCAADRLELVVTHAPNPSMQTNRVHTLLAHGVRVVAPPQDEPTERIRVRWVPVDEAVRLAMTGGVAQSMHVAGLATALGRLGRWRMPGEAR